MLLEFSRPAGKVEDTDNATLGINNPDGLAAVGEIELDLLL